MKNGGKGKKAIMMGILGSMMQPQPSSVTNVNITLGSDSNVDTPIESTEAPIVKDSDKYEEQQMKTVKEKDTKELAEKKEMQDDSLIKSDITLLTKKMDKMDTDSILEELENIISKYSLDNASIENEVNKETKFFKDKRTVAAL